MHYYSSTKGQREREWDLSYEEEQEKSRSRSRIKIRTKQNFGSTRRLVGVQPFARRTEGR